MSATETFYHEVARMILEMATATKDLLEPVEKGGLPLSPAARHHCTVPDFSEVENAPYDLWDFSDLIDLFEDEEVYQELHREAFPSRKEVPNLGDPSSLSDLITFVLDPQVHTHGFNLEWFVTTEEIDEALSGFFWGDY